MNFIYSAIGGTTLIFITSILQKNNKTRADYLLIAINFIICLFLLSDALVKWKLTSATVIFQNLVPLLLFPVYVFYLQQYTNVNKNVNKLWYLTFLPFVLFSFLSTIDHFILDNYKTPKEILEHFNTPSISYHLIFKGSQIIFISILIHSTLSFKKIKRKLKDGFSTIEDTDLRWLEHFSWIYLGCISISFILFIGQNIGVFPFNVQTVYGIIFGILTLATFYLNYNGIRNYASIQKLKYNEDQEEKYTKLTNEYSLEFIEKKLVELSEEELNIEQKMLHLIEQEQLFLDPKFSLNDLANHMLTNKHHVSKIINGRKDRSFYSLINIHRVENLKKLLQDVNNSSFTILSLGFESGFNSKSSMNRVFKNFSGLTPKQFLYQTSHSRN